MCIRDSFDTETTPPSAEYREALLVLDDATSVSYTHLDVYKRQTL